MQWLPKIKEQDPMELNTFGELEIPISPLTARLLKGRGINTIELAQKFLKPNFSTDLHNPLLMKDVKKAVERIKLAKENKEKILLLTDYDTDGVFTTYVGQKILKDVLGLDVEYYAPNRFTDGYGINPKNFNKFKEYPLIISGDTGIKAFEAISMLTDYGVDVIVTDHHEPMILEETKENRKIIPPNTVVLEDENEFMILPKAYAVVNPKRLDCEYPSKDLCGAGVMFKLMQALLDDLNYDKQVLYFLLDGVASASVADLVPLMDTKRGSFEVRNMVKIGLGIMNMQPKPWTTSILDIQLRERLEKNPNTKNELARVDSTMLGFTYGPILNAAGRLYDPKPAIEYVLEDEEMLSFEKANQLMAINKERQTISNGLSKVFVERMKGLPENRRDYAIVVTTQDVLDGIDEGKLILDADDVKIHQGVTGLIAGKILEEFYRTTIAFADVISEDGEENLTGSARSIDGVDVYQALIGVEKEFGPYKYGGHEQAAGLTIPKKRIGEFIELFRKNVMEQVKYKGEESVFEPKKYYDVEMNLSNATHEQIEQIEALKPFGMGNPEPLFYAGDVKIKKLTRMGKEGQYAKFILSQGGTTIEAIMFNKAVVAIEEYLDKVAKNPWANVLCEILFVMNVNDYNNKVQLQIKELKFL